MERIVFSGLALGMIDFCLKSMIKFGSERKQFGQSVGEFQLYQERVAYASSTFDLLHHYSYHLADCLDQKKKLTKEAATLKLLASQMTSKVTSDAVSALGGAGYMQEYQVERCFRDAKLFEIGGGTSDIQKIIIAKEVSKEVLNAVSKNK